MFNLRFNLLFIFFNSQKDKYNLNLEIKAN